MEQIFEPEYLYDHGVRRSQRRDLKDVIEGYVSSDEGETVAKFLVLETYNGLPTSPTV